MHSLSHADTDETPCDIQDSSCDQRLHPQSRSAGWHTQHKHLPDSPHQAIGLLDRKSEPETALSLGSINLDFVIVRTINSAGGRTDLLRCHPKSKILNKY